MSLTIKKGYLIARKDYDLFDEVLTFISNDGQRYSIFAPGVRKITSKNSRNLFYGNYLEFEFFQARFNNKVSKLKKVTTLSNIGYELSNHPSLDLISNILDNINPYRFNYFSFYQNILGDILLNQNESLINIKIYLYFLKEKQIINNQNFCQCKHIKNELIGVDLIKQQFVCQKCLSLDTVLLVQETLVMLKKILTSKFINIEIDHDFLIIESILKKLFNLNRKIIYGK